MTAAAPGKQRERGGDTEHPTVKGHAAFPEPEWIPRVVCPERQAVEQHVADAPAENHTEHGEENHIDRKSTRLNSSHLVISYAVFCLKKKNCAVQKRMGKIQIFELLSGKVGKLVRG